MSTLVGDNEVIGKSGKKSKRSKKKEIDEVEELINREDVEEDGLEKIGKKSKNSNKKKEMNDRSLTLVFLSKSSINSVDSWGFNNFRGTTCDPSLSCAPTFKL